MARTPAKKTEEAVVKTVRLVRDAEVYPAPHTCDCHPDEVANYASGGWVKA